MKTLLAIIFIFITSSAYPADPPVSPILRLETGMHTATAGKLSIDSNSKWLVSGSNDKTVRVWNVTTGKLDKVIRPPIGLGNEGEIYSVAISPDGKLIACSGNTTFNNGIKERYLSTGMSIYLFSRVTGKMLNRSGGLPNTVNHLVFSPDGKQLIATLGGKSGIRVFSVDNNNLTFNWGDTDYEDDTYSADFSSHATLVTSSFDGYIRLYNTNGIIRDETLKPIKAWKSPDSVRPVSVKFSPDYNKIAVAYVDSNHIDILDAYTLRLIIRPNTDGILKGKLNAVTWSNDGTQLYAAGSWMKQIGEHWYYTIRCWDANNFRRFNDYRLGANARIFDMLPAGNKLVAYSSADPVIGILSNKGEKLFFKYPVTAGFQERGDKLQVSSDGLNIKYFFRHWSKEYSFFSTTKDFKKSNGIYFEPVLYAKALSFSGKKNKSINDILINGKPIEIEESRYVAENEQLISYCISKDGNTLIGTNFHIRLYDKQGRLLWKQVAPEVVWAVNIDPNTNFAIVALGDGTIRWYNYHGGQEVLAYFPHTDPGRWVMWTPEGYFDSSPDGADLIGYHINQGINKEAKFVPMSQLYDVFYRPDILQAKLKGEDISSLITLTVEEALKTPPPEVKFTTIPSKSAVKTAKVCYQVKSTGGGIGEVRLFHNGKLIKSDGFYRETAKREASDKIQIASMNSRAIYQDQRGLVVREKKAANAAISKLKGDLVDECVEIETITGENEISLAAFNAPNTVQGFIETATFVSTRKADEPHLYILSVGIDTYRDSSINLKYAAKDAKDFIAKLPEKARSIYKPQNIHILTLTNQQADKESILKAIDDLATKVKHGDGFIFFNASHGVLLQNQYYIVTAGFDGNLDDTNSLIGSNEIVEMSKRIKSLSQLFIFDTCHAGGVDNIVSGLYDARMSVLAKKMGLHIYASAGSVQTAMDGYQGNGLYTYTLLKGIANGRQVDKEKTGKVTVKSLGLYTKEKTNEISTRLGQPQTPFIINFGRDNPLFVVR